MWVLVQHQLISDSWSFRILCDRVLERYRAPNAVGIPRPPQFAEYREYERRLRTASTAADARAHWRRSYGGAVDGAQRPVGRERTRVSRTIHRLGARRTAAIRALAAGAATPPDLATFVTVASAIVAHVHRTTGSRDVLLDVPFANRPSLRFKKTFGSFMNVCPVRVGIESGDCARSLRSRMLEATWEAARHQGYAGRGGAVPQPYDVLVNVHRSDVVVASFDTCTTNVEWLAPTHRFGGVGVSVHDFGATGDMSLVLDFNEATFGPATRADFVASLVALLDAQLADPERRIRDADRSPAAPKPPPLVSEATVWSRFTAQTTRTPAAVAIRAGSRCVTYEALHGHASAIAALLAANDVAREEIVAVVGPRAPDWIAAMLGVWAHGAAYLPIDRRWPTARIARVLEQSGARIVLTAGDRSSKVRSVVPDGAWTAMPIPPAPALPRSEVGRRVDTPGPAPTTLAYVVYTSGSTGHPKGAQIEHAGFTNHLDAKIALLDLHATDRVAQTAAASFDVSLWQAVAPLLVGATTELLDGETVRDPAALHSALIDRNVTVVELVPALLDLLLTVDEARAPGLGALRWAISTGEALSPELCRRWLARYPTIPIVNAYGPTECADDVTHHVVRTPPPRGATHVSIGRPIPNVTVHVVDETLRVVPAGETGEICVGGLAVGRGYLGNASETAAAFVPDPFATEADARLYRTGDLGRWLPDGTLEWRGRRDAQTKIRGVRVDLDEIEAVLREHPSVRGAAAYVERGGSAPTATLVACVVFRDGACGDAELRAHLERYLPVVMIPSRFVALEALPLTAHGKVDRAALATAPEVRRTAEPMDRLETELERSLAAIWSRLLAVDVTGRRESFFALGGDSLLVHRMLLEVSAAFAVELGAEAFLERPTIATLAALIGGRPPGVSDAALETLLRDVEALSDAEVAGLLDRAGASDATPEVGRG